MTQTATPTLSCALWCNGTADEAAQFYTEVSATPPLPSRFPGSRRLSAFTVSSSRSSTVTTGTPRTSPFSCILNFDPLLFGGEEQARAYLDELYEKLSSGGVLMELGEYPFSPATPGSVTVSV